MNNNERITVPDNFKVAVEAPQEMPTSTPLDVPEAMKVTPVAPENVVAVDIIEEAPFNIEVYQIPHTKLGQEALKGMIAVPGATGAEVIEPGTPSVGQVRQVVNLGGIDDFKGGNPGNVIGFDGIVRK